MIDNETLALVALELAARAETPAEAERLVALLAEEYGEEDDPEDDETPQSE